VREKDTIFIDEVQFFNKSIIDAIERVIEKGRDVIASGLDTNYRAEPFGSVPELIHLADEVISLEAICVVCGKPATRSQRVVDDHFAKKEDKTIVVGGKELYEARCSDCFVKPK
jgi:thymidine kinase